MRDGLRVEQRAQAQKAFVRRLTALEYEGFKGLSHALVIKALGFQPQIARARPTTTRPDSKKQSYFSDKSFANLTWPLAVGGILRVG